MTGSHDYSHAADTQWPRARLSVVFNVSDVYESVYIDERNIRSVISFGIFIQKGSEANSLPRGCPPLLRHNNKQQA